MHINAVKFPKINNNDKESILVLFQDLTKQKNNEKELEALNKTKDQFLSVLAHDLRSPFNGILGYLSVLIRNVEEYDREKIKEMLNIIYSTSEKTFFLLENLLKWASSQQNKLPFNPV